MADRKHSGPDISDAETEPCHKRPKSSQAETWPEEDASEGAMWLEDLEALAGAGALDGEAALEEVLTSEHLLNLVFAHLCLEDLCRAAMVRRRWREVTSNPEFWRTLNLRGRTLMVCKVRALLARHSEVRVLNARGVAFGQADLLALLPLLNQLESLELEKGGYERAELDALGAHLPCLTRLVLAGGLLGPQMTHDWTVLAHPRVESLGLEAGRAARLRISAPRLTSLSLRDFSAAAIQLADTPHLAELSVADCSKLTDGVLRGLLCLEGAGQQALLALTSVTLATVPNVGDETLRLLGQRHKSVARLSLAGCGAVSGSGLVAPGGYAALRSLSVQFCDSLSGALLSDAVRELHSLEELSITGCTQVSTLRLHSWQLARLALCGTRALQQLHLRCARLASIDILPVSPGLAASLALKRIMLASHAVRRLQWSAFPALESVRLQCPNLEELDLSECHALKDSVFESLGPGPGGVAGYVATGDNVMPGCPQLRVLQLGDCEALRHAKLSSQTLESLQLSQCRWLLSVQLDCPMLTQLSLQECTHLEEVALQSRHMRGMSLGTCPRLGSISIQCDTMEKLDLRGCNQLRSLQLTCPALRFIDATFCKSLSDAAIQSIAQCQALEELVLAACDSVTIAGLGALSQLSRLRRLDLSYTALEDPSSVYQACRQLTSLSLSNNYALRPEALLPLFPPPEPSAGVGEAAAAPGEAAAAPACALPAGADGSGRGLPGPLLPELRALDVGYCPLPAPVLAEVVCRASKLHSLSINGCRGGVTDALWPLLHRRMPQPAVAALERAVAAAGPDSDHAACEQLVETFWLMPAARASMAACAAAPEPAGAPLAAGEGEPPTHPRSPIAACFSAASAAYRHVAAAQACCRQHELRSLSMVGSKELRHFCLGLVPTAAALEHGLLIGGSAMTVGPGGQHYVPVDCMLGGLRELRLSISSRLRSLSLELPQLEDLQLNNCGELACLVLHCSRLARLSLQACRALPEAALRTALVHCTALRELDLQYCPQVTPSVVAALRRSCPSLQHIHVTPPRAASP